MPKETGQPLRAQYNREKLRWAPTQLLMRGYANPRLESC